MNVQFDLLCLDRVQCSF